MINAILTPLRRMLLGFSFLLFGAGIAQADGGSCRWWCGSGVCCQMDESGLCQPKQCVKGCGDLAGWTSNSDVGNFCTGDEM